VAYLRGGSPRCVTFFDRGVDSLEGALYKTAVIREWVKFVKSSEYLRYVQPLISKGYNYTIKIY